MTIEELEQALLALTDRLDHLDPLVQGMEHLYFRCSHSGLFFPADYLSQWGRKYGVGLGPQPVSECLNSRYDIFPTAHSNMRSELDVMHPLDVSMAPVVPVFSTDVMPPGRMLVLAMDDPWNYVRSKFLRAKQLLNPANQIQLALGAAKAQGVQLYSPAPAPTGTPTNPSPDPEV